MRHEREKFVGNVTSYIFQARYRPIRFLQRNIDDAIAYNDYQLYKSGKSINGSVPRPPELRPSRRTRKTKIDDIVEDLKPKISVAHEDPILKINILDLQVKDDGKDLEVPHASAHTRNHGRTVFRCRAELLIYCEANGIYGNSRELLRVTELCNVSINYTGNSCRVQMDDPFLVKASTLFTLQKGQKEFTLAEKYTAQISLEAVDSSATWPLLQNCKNLPTGWDDPLAVKLKTYIRNFPVLPPAGSRLPVLITDAAPTSKQKLVEKVGKSTLWMGMDCAWSSPFEKARPELALKSLNRDLVILPGSHSENNKPLIRESRPVTKIEYTFSDGSDDFLLNGPKSSATAIRFEVQEELPTCPFCARKSFRSAARLSFHFVTCHGDKFEFKFDNISKAKGNGVLRVRIELRKTFEESSNERTRDPRNFLWIKPSKPFYMRSILAGKWNWLNDNLRNTPSPSQSSAGTLKETAPVPQQVDEDTLAAERVKRILEAPEVPAPKKRKFVVPKPQVSDPTQPVYMRTKSKRFVQVGEELSESDEEIDEEWILMKHEETINDYIDITQNEKHFMTIWNRHIYNERPCSYIQIPPVLVRFCRANRGWLKDSPLLLEFWKMCLCFIQFDIIDTHMLKACIEIINGGERSLEAQFSESSVSQVATPHNRKAKQTGGRGNSPSISSATNAMQKGEAHMFDGSCICRMPWRQPEMVACEGNACKVGWYHMGCVGLKGRPSSWKCGDCRNAEDD